SDGLALVASPSDGALQAARAAWIDAREWYGTTEVFRFHDTPIDVEGGPEAYINSWPLDEQYIDYVADLANGGAPLLVGIVNQPELYGDVTRDALIALNQPQEVGETAVATGYHAIEFLLWGQDLYADTAGRRAFADFVDGDGPGRPDRRRAYLTVVDDLLVDDLQGVVDAWGPYRDTLATRAVDEALLGVLTGMGSLAGAELSGERMQVAWDSQSQEDEHSCFSDNTHRDVVRDIEGLRAVWGGRYERADGSVVEGPSLADVVASADPALADRTTADLDAAVEAAEQIRRFDQDIQSEDGRVIIKAVIDALGVVTGDVVDAADALGLRLNLEG
ncbi:MAG TPA: imelysin family protein, partial [Myxococcota bacterium]|nr:imelysin family protein [Myxococcota bacterium]